MIDLETRNIVGFEEAITSMRNPLNSWHLSDSYFRDFDDEQSINFVIGRKDLELANSLVYAGPVHCKFRRMINVYVDITAPLYWWKQFDTYKIGTVCNSCSTMHKIHDREFDISMFSFETVGDIIPCVTDLVVEYLNALREKYLETKDKKYWQAMIELLPEGYNQKRTVMLNYEVLSNIYKTRKDHKLKEWHDFCDWICELPYSEFIVD